MTANFKAGDRVVIGEAGGYEPQAVANALYRGRQGTVTNVITEDGYPYPYEVTFDNGGPLGFAETELTPVRPEGQGVVEPRLPAAPELASRTVVSPEHYTSHPSGIECIEITQHMNFPLGNAMKYIWRAGLKHPDAITDLEKAKQYIEIEIERIREFA
ncbi:DUF3310 domain-containing protein [Streptomyces sp. NPDC014733]|uniref:DUF3310 domain-containing protein n=1 Tax=Streptomyces sp. NPDC014733 TaxID=3364885 RepID=UPI0036FC9DBF